MIILLLSLVPFAQSKGYPPSYNGPVVGILTQWAWGKLSPYGNSYLGASYVKFVELSGKNQSDNVEPTARLRFVYILTIFLTKIFFQVPM